jgi:hypothetical protein
VSKIGDLTTAWGTIDEFGVFTEHPKGDDVCVNGQLIKAADYLEHRKFVAQMDLMATMYPGGTVVTPVPPQGAKARNRPRKPARQPEAPPEKTRKKK